ncbi:hypothetical protein BRD17_00440 [Halobacteriales archaeon SW_7_68_16]|nr:MAG: hypothetical protein BRD17_00440 [Halobacteriales archaeon SW_7_68_16]
MNDDGPTIDLAGDERARVPFALVAIVLLVGASTLAVAIQSDRPGGTTPDVGAAMDRATATTRGAVRASARTAIRRAARNPVTDPADTAVGRSVRPSRPFQSSVEARLTFALRSRIDGIDERVGRARVTASVPAVTNASTYRAANRNVTVRHRNGTARVTVKNVTLTASVGDRIVDREHRSVSVAVATPAFRLADAAARFDHRLSRGPTDGSGLGRRLAAYLYAISWARGYAQYSRTVPIQNVLGTHHVGVAANAALASEQRVAFGATDPDTDTVLGCAMAHTGLADGIASWNAVHGSDHSLPSLVDLCLGDGTADAPASPRAALGLGDGGPTPETNTTVTVGRTADLAFARFLDDGEPTLNGTIQDTYAARARSVVRVRRIVDGEPGQKRPPGPNWTVADTERTVETDVTVDDGVQSPVIDEYRVADRYGRIVSRRWTQTTTWTRGNDTWTGRTSWYDAYAVGIAVVTDPILTRYGPDRPVDRLYVRGGPLDDPNLRSVPDRAVNGTLDPVGGVDGAAIGYALETGPSGERTATGPWRRFRGRRPDGLRAWLYDDLVGLRERVRNVSVTVQRGRMGTDVNAAARLAERLRSRRGTLVDAPPSYRNVADRARVAARSAYIHRLLGTLDRRAAAVERTQRRTRSEIDALADTGVTDVGDVLRARSADPTTAGTLDREGPWRPVSVTPDLDPTYLTLDPVTSERVPGVAPGHDFEPAAVRVQNLFTVPYRDAADTVVDGVLDDGATDTVTPATAARALVAANRTAARSDGIDDALATRRRELTGTLRSTLDRIGARTTAGLSGVVGLNATRRRAAVAAGLRTTPGLGNRTLAAVEGDVADEIAARLADRAGVRTARGRDRIAVATRLALADAVRATDARPPQSPVAAVVDNLRDRTAENVRSTVGDLAGNLSERATRRLAGRSVFAGLPVAPVPGYWYATTNVWLVEYNLTYARVTLRSNRGDPLGGPVRYVRDGRPAHVPDVNGDGRRDRLGTAPRIGGSGTIPVTVVVPPGSVGVGDTDGDADERSPGWPGAGRRRVGQDRA